MKEAEGEQKKSVSRLQDEVCHVMSFTQYDVLYTSVSK